MYARTREEFGRIDVLFNNAGISPDDDASVLDTTLEAWQRVQRVNLESVFLCCKHGIPHLLDNACPPAARSSTPRRSSPCSARRRRRSPTPPPRAACWRCRASSGVEFARRGVRVNALCPGPVETPLLMELFANDPEKAARRYVHVPMGRFGKPEEIANGVVFLASDESSFMTASTFLVDGGISGAYVTPE